MQLNTEGFHKDAFKKMPCMSLASCKGAWMDTAGLKLVCCITIMLAQDYTVKAHGSHAITQALD